MGRVRVKAGPKPGNDGRPARPRVAYTLRVTAVTVSALLLTAVGAVAASPVEQWKAIPLLPSVAETAQCDAVDPVMAQIEAAAAQSLEEAQRTLPTMTPVAVTDGQGEAITALLDYSLQECALKAEMDVQQLVQSETGRLSAAMSDLGARHIAALERCGSEMSPGYQACYSRTRIEYRALARDTANHHLDAIGTTFADWRDRTKACVDRRERAVARFERARVSGPFATQGLNVRSQTWMLVALHARTSRELCDAVHEAAHVMDIE